MTELEMYELWCTLRLWNNYNQLNQTIEKNWLSNSFNSHILDLLDKEEIKYRSEKRLLGYRNKGKGDLLVMQISRLLSVLMMWLMSLMFVRKMNSLE